eukprot:897582-Amphidinium_carterae.1
MPFATPSSVTTSGPPGREAGCGCKLVSCTTSSKLFSLNALTTASLKRTSRFGRPTLLCC